MTIEDQLRQAMVDEAETVPWPADRWAEIEDQAAAVRRDEARRRNHRRTGGLTFLGLAAAAAAAALLVPALHRESGHRVVVTPGTQPTIVVNPRPSPTTTAPGSSPSTTAPGASPSPSVGPTSNYQPLYPFRSLQEANAWQAGYTATGAQPWHLDPGQTTLSFTGFLGYPDVTTVFKVTNDSIGAHVTVGFPDPNGNPVDAAVVHLRRFGTGANAPWEVVGTDDTPSFSLSAPHYGATVKSPIAVGGAIIGVDQNIRVVVLQASSNTPLGAFCCVLAGSTGAPWSGSVDFHGATDNLLIVAASTGGHLATVERFAVTGVRTSGGTTPGL